MKNEVLQLIGERIRNARKRAKLSQTALGKLVGYSMNGIAKIERGESDPKFSVLGLISKELELPLSEMVMPPNPSGDEATVDYFWKFLRSDDNLFSIERHTMPDGQPNLRITRGTRPYRPRGEDDMFMDGEDED